MMNPGSSQIVTAQARRTERRDYQILYAFAVTCFFAVSICSRILPRSLRPFANSGAPGESCFSEARRMANAVIPYVFEW